MRKLRVGLVGLCQPNFNVPLGREIYNRSVTFMERLGVETQEFGLFAIPSLVATPEEARTAAKKLKDEGIGFLLIQHATLSSGELVFPFVEMDVPLGLWALPEPTISGTIPLGSLIGMNLCSGILGRYFKDKVVRFKWFFGAPGEAALVRRLVTSFRALKAIELLKGSCITLIGEVAPGFYSLHFDPRDVYVRFGTKVAFGEFCELKERVLSLDVPEVFAIVKEMREMGSGSLIDEKDFEKAARVYFVLREMAERHGYGGLAIECWPRFYRELDLVPCSVIGFLNEKGIATACEGDVWGVLSMMLLNYLSEGGRSTLMDLAMFDNVDDSILFWHCGPTAACWASGRGLIYAPHCNIGEGVPWSSFKGASMVNDLVLREGEITIARITKDGKKIFVGSGRSVGERKPGYDGSRGWVEELYVGREKSTAPDFVNTVMVHGVEHHFPIVMGNLVEELMEFGNWLGLEVLPLVPYAVHYQKPRE